MLLIAPTAVSVPVMLLLRLRVISLREALSAVPMMPDAVCALMPAVEVLSVPSAAMGATLTVMFLIVPLETFAAKPAAFLFALTVPFTVTVTVSAPAVFMKPANAPTESSPVMFAAVMLTLLILEPLLAAPTKPPALVASSFSSPPMFAVQFAIVPEFMPTKPPEFSPALTLAPAGAVRSQFLSEPEFMPTSRPAVVFAVTLAVLSILASTLSTVPLFSTASSPTVSVLLFPKADERLTTRSDTVPDSSMTLNIGLLKPLTVFSEPL